MDPSIQQIVTSPNFYKVILFSGGIFIAALAIVAGCIRSIVASRANERVRREIAAYIAEGAMTPEQGERILRGGGRERASSTCGWGC